MSIRDKKDFYASLVLLLVCSLLLRSLSTINVSIEYALGPIFFPRIVLGVILVMAAILFLKSIKFEAMPSTAKCAEPKKPLPIEVFYQLGTVGLLALYLFFLPIFGYVPSTIVFLFITILMLGPKTKKGIAIYLVVAMTVAFLLHYIFASVLKLFLP